MRKIVKRYSSLFECKKAWIWLVLCIIDCLYTLLLVNLCCKIYFCRVFYSFEGIFRIIYRVE